MNAEQFSKIEQLYNEMFAKMKIYACCSFDSVALAEEAVQETFSIACQKSDQLCESVNPRGWLMQTLKYTIRNMQRTQATTKRIMERYLQEQITDFSSLDDTIDLRILYDHVSDTEEFKLLAEMVIEGRSHLEMAKSRGISVDACKKRVQRAKEALRKKFEE